MRQEGCILRRDLPRMILGQMDCQETQNSFRFHERFRALVALHGSGIESTLAAREREVYSDGAKDRQHFNEVRNTARITELQSGSSAGVIMITVTQPRNQFICLSLYPVVVDHNRIYCLSLKSRLKPVTNCSTASKRFGHRIDGRRWFACHLMCWSIDTYLLTSFAEKTD